MTTVPTASNMPRGMALQVRNIRFELSQPLASDWLDNDAFKTAFFNALSMTFPAGEGFFIESVKHFRDEVTDPKLKDEICQFIAQEGNHSREHRKYNRLLCQLRGYDQKKMEGRTEKMVQVGKEKMPPIIRLAATCGVEHLTAIFADKMLNSWMVSDMEPTMKSLWQWHSAEELEHKSVAYDVYSLFGGTYRARRITMRFFTMHFLWNLLANTFYMLRKDRQLWKWATFKSGFKFFFAKGGVLRELGPDYLRYFDENFHPWDDDNRHLLENWQASMTSA